MKLLVDQRALQDIQLIQHIALSRQRQPLMALMDQVIHLTIEQQGKGLLDAGHRAQLQMIRRVGIEGGSEAASGQGHTPTTAQVIPATVGKGLAPAHEDHTGNLHERRVDVVHLPQPFRCQKGTGQHIHPATAHLLLGLAPTPHVQRIDMDASGFQRLFQQLHGRPDQPPRVIRIHPQQRRVVGIAGNHDALADTARAVSDAACQHHCQCGGARPDTQSCHPLAP